MNSEQKTLQQLEAVLRQLYQVYITLRDQDLQATSNTSRLLHEKDQTYLARRVKDELNELSGVIKGEHVHRGKQADTALEGSQVSYWLFLLASLQHVAYEDFMPHASILLGYIGQYNRKKVDELQQSCVQQIASTDTVQFAHGLANGFSFVGWACVSAGISPLAPAEYDLSQMHEKGLVS